MSDLSRWYKSGGALLREIEASPEIPGMVYIWFLGQLGFVIKLKGLVFYIDILLNDLCDEYGKSLRVYPPPFPPEAVNRIDYFLCTHNHADHLNLETLLPLAKANPHVRFIVPMPHVGVLTGSGLEQSRVIGAREGEILDLSHNVTLSPVAAAHTDYVRDEQGDYLCLGYVLKGDGTAWYHAGDTVVTTRLVDTLKKLRPIDGAILPINGSDWERAAADIVGNLHIKDGVKLARALDTDLVIPAHYDMIRGNEENPALFTDYLYKLCPEKKHHVFALGERYCYYREK
jgi:L-ascorbate metabolism protein UlaG (beta-lactamase superfamily)